MMRSARSLVAYSSTPLGPGAAQRCDRASAGRRAALQILIHGASVAVHTFSSQAATRL